MTPAETDLDMQLMLFAILSVTGLDYNMVPKVEAQARKYRANGYTAENVAKAQQLCIHTDWRWTDPKRGNSSRRLTLQDLTEYLGRTRTATSEFQYAPEMELDAIIRRVRATGDIAAIDPAAVPMLPPGEDIADDVPPPRLPAIQNDHWLAMLGDMRVSLNVATWQTWFSDLCLITFTRGADRDTFTAHTNSPYTKAYLAKHALQAMERKLAAIHRKPVVIVIESD